ncbi:MAG: hypothetical protein A3H32_04225 [Betaproteobacteria bacterium RIFCSPLOWO2_02_FULL_63_19]|nr:MAG: hypothetical protein A3H32_04225 [Betaproteobacteria bacterium RIFCSPLOWO2_02_FULL_63_19]
MNLRLIMRALPDLLLDAGGDLAHACSTAGQWFFLSLASPLLLAVTLTCATQSAAYAQSKNLAPGFDFLPKGSTIVIMPTDIELFEISAGGVHEPKAAWSAAAAKHFRAALDARRKRLGVTTVFLSEKSADETAEINALHAAVARAISLHHFGPPSYNLPTKEGKLAWSLGEPVQKIKERAGAQYAFFSWIRDSYASGERVAAMIALALLGVGTSGGQQVGYASLVDLNSGKILWFNRLARMSGDLRDAEKARETLDALLEGFPATK